MKLSKYLPVFTLLLCVPGVLLRTMHVLYGFDATTGLPERQNLWFLGCIALFALSGVFFAVISAPLRAQKETPFEQLLGTSAPLFRTVAAAAALLIIAGGVAYLYLTVTVPDPDSTGWAHILEFIYAFLTILTGVSCIAMASAQGREQTEKSALLTIVPLIWSCIHLLITYRLTCVDPKLPSFTFGLIGDILLVLACYQLARMLYSTPSPSALAFSQALTILVCVSDLGGYVFARLLGGQTLIWPLKSLIRDGISAAFCLLLLADLWILSLRTKTKVGQHMLRSS